MDTAPVRPLVLACYDIPTRSQGAGARNSIEDSSERWGRMEVGPEVASYLIPRLSCNPAKGLLLGMDPVTR